MLVSNNSKLTKFVLFVLLILFTAAIVFLPYGLAMLDLPYKIFLLALLTFFIIYSKSIGGYFFISTLLNLIDKGEDIYDHISKKLSKDSIQKYLFEWSLLALVETQLNKVKEITSILYDITLVFLLGVVTMFLSGFMLPPVFYALVFAVVIVWVFTAFVELYVSLKFVRIFEEEIAEMEKELKIINNSIQNYNEDVENIEENKEEENSEEKNN